MTLEPRTARLLLARLARTQIQGRAPSVLAGVVRKGALAWSAGRGDVVGPPQDVQYRIGSITKTFAAVLVLRLRDAGRLRLGEPVETYLPGCGLGPATVAQLLAHTAGLRSETAGPWWERTAGADYAALERTTLRAGGARVDEPSRTFHYSNTGYGLLGEIAARLHGAPWPAVLQREILDPLGMTRTTMRPQSPAAQGFAVHPWADVLLPEPEHDHGAMAPAGQLWSTLTDLARWCTVLAGGSDLLSTATLAEMTAPQGLGDVREGGWESAYGLGLQLWNAGGERTHGHSGSMPGFLALVRTVVGGDGVVLLANATSGVDIGPTSTDLLRIVAENDPLLPEPWRPTPVAAALLPLLGVWYWGPTPLALTATGGGDLEIVAVGRGGRLTRLVAAGADRWRALDGYYTGETLVVARAADGTVRHLDIGSFVLTRQPYEPGVGVPGGDIPWEV